MKMISFLLLGCIFGCVFKSEVIAQDSNCFKSNSNYQTLRLVCSNVKEADLKQLKNYKNLQRLTIKNSHLKKIPKEISQLLKLEYLNLEGNLIEGIDSSSSMSLRILSLKNNRIADISQIDNFPSLETLDLSYNRLTNINGIMKLEKITNLNLKNNYLFEKKSLNSQIKVNYEKNFIVDLKNNKTLNIYKDSVVTYYFNSAQVGASLKNYLVANDGTYLIPVFSYQLCDFKYNEKFIDLNELAKKKYELLRANICVINSNGKMLKTNNQITVNVVYDSNKNVVGTDEVARNNHLILPFYHKTFYEGLWKTYRNLKYITSKKVFLSSNKQIEINKDLQFITNEKKKNSFPFSKKDIINDSEAMNNWIILSVLFFLVCLFPLVILFIVGFRIKKEFKKLEEL